MRKTSSRTSRTRTRPEKLAADFDLVAEELKRIAGCAYTAGLQIHWADVPPDCYQVLADRGVKMLATRGRTPGSTDRKIGDYHLPDNILEYLALPAGLDAFRKRPDLLQRLDRRLRLDAGGQDRREHSPPDRGPAKSHLIKIAGHEQYWWPFYKNFVPDIYVSCDRSPAMPGLKPTRDNRIHDTSRAASPANHGS